MFSKQVNNKKWAFFGTDEFAVCVLEKLRLEGLVPSLIVCAPDRPQGRGLVMTPPAVAMWAKYVQCGNEESGAVPIFQPESLRKEEYKESVLKALDEPKFDFFLVASYGKIIPQEILDLPAHGALNIHPSLLPKYRGASPIETSILDNSGTGEKFETGVTLMKMDAEMDHGPIVAQKEAVFAFLGDTPKRELEKALANIGADLVVENLEAYISGALIPQPQNHALATCTKKITKEDGLITGKESPREIFLKSVAFEGWPGIYFIHKDKNGIDVRVKINKVAWKNSALEILELTPEGKKPMDLESFIRGYGEPSLTTLSSTFS